MSRRVWVKHLYFREVLTKATCLRCEGPFSYIKTSRPQVRCRPCARTFHLERMRIKNAEYRRDEKIKLGLAHA